MADFPTAGDDIIFGNGRPNLIDGLGGHDTIFGLTGNDTLIGNAGDDFLSGGPGLDSLKGGSGRDTAYYGLLNEPVFASLILKYGYIVSLGASDYDVFDSIENLEGGGGGDHLIGSNGANTLTGNNGDDRLFGMDGADVINGGGGGDIVNGGFGADIMSGGGGRDLLSYELEEEAVTVNLSTGLGTGGAAEGDQFTGFEDVTGGLLGDKLTGNRGPNTIAGGGGGDILTGGSNGDTFLYMLLSDSGATGAARDRITDFDAAEDVLDFTFDANTLLAGTQGFTFIGTDSFHDGVGGEVRYSFQNGQTILAFRTDGAGGADMRIVLSGEIVLTGDNFI